MAYSHLGKSRTVISHNVNTLNIPEKRSKLLKELKKTKPSIVFLQETHFKGQNIPKLTDNNFTKVFHATNPLAKTKGTSIFLNKNSPFELISQLTDPEGRYIFLKGTWEGSPVTLANVYFPNKSHITFCNKIISELKWFAEGCIILGSDFNIPLSLTQDTSNGHTHVSYRILKRIKMLLQSLMLVDSWRLLHPSGKDFSFSSPPHKNYSRIDLIFISQRNLNTLSNAEIGIIALSDYSPVAVTLTLGPIQKPPFNWRLNAALLTDPSVHDGIHESIKSYFEINRDSDTDPLNNWEAHKSVIRGEFIKWGARKKRERDKEIFLLSCKIARLETLHKQSLSDKVTDELAQHRTSLKQLLNLQTQRSLFFKKSIFYEQEIKEGSSWLGLRRTLLW